jgi:hypothetical protein
MKEDPMYKGLKITFLMCATPSIDSQILIFQHLGTRELLYRPKFEDIKEVMEKIWENSELESRMRKELNEITIGFIEDRNIINKEITLEDEEFLKSCGIFISYLRASGEVDSYTGELRNFVYPEMPTRVLKQLRKMFIALLNLEEDYPIDRAKDCILEITKSSVNPVRVEIIRLLLLKVDDKELTTQKVADLLNLGFKTVYTELNILSALSIVNKKTDEYADQRYNPPKLWSINKDYPYLDFLEEIIRFSL